MFNQVVRPKNIMTMRKGFAYMVSVNLGTCYKFLHNAPFLFMEAFKIA